MSMINEKKYIHAPNHVMYKYGMNFYNASMQHFSSSLHDFFYAFGIVLSLFVPFAHIFFKLFFQLFISFFFSILFT